MSPTTEQTLLDEHAITWRCHRCRRILLKLEAAPRGVLEVKCKCNAVNRMAGKRK